MGFISIGQFSRIQPSAPNSISNPFGNPFPATHHKGEADVFTESITAPRPRSFGIGWRGFSFLPLLAPILLAGCLQKSKPAPVGIIGALPQEVEAVRKLMVGNREETVHGKTIYLGTIEGTPVVLVESGVGKVNAAATTQLLVTEYGTKEIIFSGVAGGVNPKHKVGDVVIAERVAQHDYGMVTPSEKLTWRPATFPFKKTDVDTLWYPLGASALFQGLKVAVGRAQLATVPEELRAGGEIPSIRFGTVVTGDEFIASEQKRKWLEETFGADAVEMEGGDFAQVCENNQISCVIIRTVSDLANENAHVDFPRFAAYAAQNSAALIRALLLVRAGEKQ